MKGKFFLMCYGLINEYNPEIIEKVKDKLPIKVDEVELEEFYDAEILKGILNELSPGAREVIGKNVFPTINKTTGAFKEAKDPAPLFQMLPTIYTDNNIDDEGGDIGKYDPADMKTEDGKAIIKENSTWSGDFSRGIMMGIVLVTGFRGNIRSKTEVIEDKEKGHPTFIHTITWK